MLVGWVGFVFGVQKVFVGCSVFLFSPQHGGDGGGDNRNRHAKDNEMGDFL